MRGEDVRSCGLLCLMLVPGVYAGMRSFAVERLWSCMLGLDGASVVLESHLYPLLFRGSNSFEFDFDSDSRIEDVVLHL